MNVKQHKYGTVVLEFGAAEEVGLFKEMRCGVVIEMTEDLAREVLTKLHQVLNYKGE